MPGSTVQIFRNIKFRQIYLMRKLLVVSLLITFALSAQVKVTCTDSSACAQGFAYTFTSVDGSSTYYCVDSCPFNTQLTLDVIKCTQDIDGKTCSTGVCLSPANLAFCYDQSQTCQTEASATINCRDCQATSCGQEVCFQSSGSQICSGETECMFSSITTRMYSCSVDTLGDACSCCLQYDLSGARTGVCSDQFPFDSDQLAEYATEASESIIFAKLSVLLIALLFIMVQ